MNRTGHLSLAGVTLLCLLGWAGHLANTSYPLNAHPLWIMRQESLQLSGLLAIALMSVAMLLASRPSWLEHPLGGLDQMYRLHKWAGIWAGIFAISHWLIKEIIGDLLKATIGQSGKLPKEKLGGLLEPMRDLAKDMGEWGFYILLAMLILALWKRFPYRPWHRLHQAMPVLYLALAFHALMWAPTQYWQQPLGLLLALLLGVGVYGSLLALAGNIGRRRQVDGHILAVEPTSTDVTGVRCQLDEGWRGHQPGQFAFITFDTSEGAHPFTIANADQGQRIIEFQIKALGDYTQGLAGRLQSGQPVKVEGPYGRFSIARINQQARQIWVAGGIGITPFLSWLSALQQQPTQAPAAELHYCTKDRDKDPFVARLESLCARLPGIQLQVHGSKQGETLDAQQMLANTRDGQEAEVWFCGPHGLAEKLQREATVDKAKFNFHKEAFEMR
jgi:predicted ferric reductase